MSDSTSRREGSAAPADGAGVLIVNADDWGQGCATTDRILECVTRRTVSSVSAMVFMKDSERAAALALQHGIDAGLHVNFTAPFSGRGIPARLVEHHERLGRYLRRHRFAAVVFHPGLAHSFRYVLAAQQDEFRRLYGGGPDRIDGHHHMHLCANVVLGNLMPAGTTVRRNFVFRAGEKGICNRMYRRLIDRLLQRRHHLSDFFFDLKPLDPDRLRRIFSLARQFSVEVEAHPADQEEYRFLTEGEILRRAGDVRIAPGYALRRSATPCLSVSAIPTTDRCPTPLTAVRPDGEWMRRS